MLLSILLIDASPIAGDKMLRGMVRRLYCVVLRSVAIPFYK